MSKQIVHPTSGIIGLSSELKSNSRWDLTITTSPIHDGNWSPLSYVFENLHREGTHLTANLHSYSHVSRNAHLAFNPNTGVLSFADENDNTILWVLDRCWIEHLPSPIRSALFPEI